MSRIRSIKPEFWASEQIVECSPIARLLFVGLWTFCDDHGVHVASVKRVKMEVFPADPFSDADIRVWVDELIAAGLLREYEVLGSKYWIVTGWHHQKIEKPNYKYPLPVGEQSANSRRIVGDSSPPEWSGVESKGVEGSGVECIVREQLLAEIFQVPAFAKSPPGDKSLAALLHDFGQNPDWMMLHVRNAVTWAASGSKSPYARAPDKPADPVRFLRNWLTKELAEHPPSKSNGVVSRITPPEDYERLRGK